MTYLLETTLYVSVTALLILLFKRIFKNRLSAKWHVYIWLLLAIRFILPSLPESRISIFNAIDVPEIAVEEHTEAIENEAMTNVGDIQLSPTTKNILPTLNETERTTPDTAPVTDIQQTVIQGNSPILSDNADMTADILQTPIPDVRYIEADPPKETTFTLENIISLIKEVGTVILLGYFVIVYLICLRKTTSHDRVVDCESISLLDKCRQKVGVERRVSLVRFGTSPMLMGLIKPIIVLPDGYSEDENKDILIHELCHLKHGDVYLIWLAMLVLCANWYNPIMWVSFFVFRRDIEVYCDERVLKHTDSKKDYAALLVKTALKKNRFIAGTTSLQNGKKEVERRVKYMAYFKKPKVLTAIVIVAVALGISAVCLTNPVGNEQKESIPQIYKNFIDGTETVEIRSENYNLAELVDSLGTIHQSVYYYFLDMNGDGVDEMHLKTSMTYYIFTIRDGKMSLWYEGTIYENPTEDGELIYIRHGGAPTNQTVIYISLDENGNEEFRETFAKYDENEDGTFETFFRDNKKITKSEYSEISGKYLSRNIIYLAKWTEIKPQQILDLSKETTSDYSEVYDKGGKIIESSKNFLLEETSPSEYYCEVRSNSGQTLIYSETYIKKPTFTHIKDSWYELKGQGKLFFLTDYINTATGKKLETLFTEGFYLTGDVIAFVDRPGTYTEDGMTRMGWLTDICLHDFVNNKPLARIDAEFLSDSLGYDYSIDYVDDTHIQVTYYTENGQKENKEIVEIPSLSGKVQENPKEQLPEPETTGKEPEKKPIEVPSEKAEVTEAPDSQSPAASYDEDLIYELFFSQENSGVIEDDTSQNTAVSQPNENETTISNTVENNSASETPSVEEIVPEVENVPAEETAVTEPEISDEAEANTDTLWNEDKETAVENGEKTEITNEEITFSGSEIFF